MVGRVVVGMERRVGMMLRVLIARPKRRRMNDPPSVHVGAVRMRRTARAGQQRRIERDCGTGVGVRVVGLVRSAPGCVPSESFIPAAIPVGLNGERSQRDASLGGDIDVRRTRVRSDDRLSRGRCIALTVRD